MKANVYFKLALRNIFSNKLLFRPYIAMSTVMVSLFFLLQTLITQLKATDSSILKQLPIVLNVGVFVCIITCFLVMIYISSFLIKQRTHELGLYSVIGVEKGSLILLISLENFLVFLFSTTAGLALGLLFAKLIYLLMLQIIRISDPIPFLITWQNVTYTVLVFLVIYGVSILLTALRMRKLNPIDILREKQKGEKAPKLNLLKSLAGLASLGAGYYIAIHSGNPLKAFSLFLVAAMLVAGGTELLFSSVSVAVLKYLQSRPKIYYKNSNLVTISTMLFRMQKNAKGLTSICILSTMLLVSFATTLALNFNIDGLIRNRYSYEAEYTYNQPDIDTAALTAKVQEAAAAHSVVAKDFSSIKDTMFFTTWKNDAYELTHGEGFSIADPMLHFVLASDFAALTGTEVNLPEGSALTLNSELKDSITLRGKGTEVRYHLLQADAESIKKFTRYNHYVVDIKTLIIRSYDEISKIVDMSEVRSIFRFNMEGTRENKLATLNALDIGGRREDAITVREEFYSIYGSLFFVGLYVSIIFLMASLLVIYYKQVTEGIEDKGRFRTLIKVGVEAREVKKMIKQQIIYVFFLPLLMAIIHLLFATPILSKLLVLLNFTNNSQLYLSCAAVSAVYFLIYCVMYKLTSRAYYHVIKQP